jgi:tetratricopeptide (TPR) repeat protein
MRNALSSLALLAFLAGCSQKPEQPPPAPAPPPVAKEPEKKPEPKARPPDISVTSKSSEAVAAFGRGRNHAELGRIAEATTEFAEAVKLDPQFALALAYLGFFNPTEEGNAMLTRAVALAEPLPQPERLLVEHLRAWRVGDAAAMRAQRKQLTELAPTDWRVHLLNGMGAQEERRWPDAEAAFRYATNLNDGAVPAWNLLAYALMNQAKFDEAIKVLETSTQKDPKEAASFDALGEAQLRAGKFEEAEKSFARAAELSPGFWSAHVGVAQARFLRGNWEEGRTALAAAKKAAVQPADKVDASSSLVWSLLAEGNEAEALKATVALEKEAKASKQGLPFAMAPVLRAVALTQSGKHGKAVGEVATAMQRAKQAGVEGDGLARLYRSALLWKLIAELRGGQIKDAEKTLAFLQKAVSMSLSVESTSTRSHAEGLVSAAKKEPRIALQQLLECTEDDYLCRLELANVQDKLGDAAAAAKIRQQLISANRREAPYLYARAQAQSVKPPP